MSRLLIAAVLAVTLGTVAHAHERRGPAPIILYEPDPIQGVGCYWARHRQICARYCYWQPDGRRYCVERERQARREHIPVLPIAPYAPRPMK